MIIFEVTSFHINKVPTKVNIQNGGTRQKKRTSFVLQRTLTKTTYMLHICDVYVAVTYICQITVHICDIYVEVLKCLYIYVTYM